MVLSPSVRMVTSGSADGASSAAIAGKGEAAIKLTISKRFNVRMITLSLCRQRPRYSSAGPAEKVDPAHEPSPPRPGGRFVLPVPRLSCAATADHVQRPADRCG